MAPTPEAPTPEAPTPEATPPEATPPRRLRPWRPRGTGRLSPSEGLPATSRVLSRIARFGSGRGATTSPLLEPLLRSVRATHPKADLARF